MQRASNEQVFLATTALEEFWDTTKPILFLGEQCRLHERRSCWEPLDARVLASPFKREGAAVDAAHYVDGIYERVLPPLGEALNAIHGTQHGTRYWRILLGPWLHHYISVAYGGHRHLKAALEQYPGCTTLLLSSESFVTPDDTAEFFKQLRKDSYHLQLYTKILTFLGRSFPAATVQANDVRQPGKVRRGIVKSIVKNAISRLYAALYARFFHSIVLRYAYFARSVEFRLMLATFGKVMPIMGEPARLPSFHPSTTLRKRLNGLAPAQDEFEACLLALLPSEIPRCFLEGFAAMHQEAAKVYPKKLKAIFSSNAWYADEPFKFWAAESAERGALLLVAQHGGTYGSLAFMPSEDHEAAIADRYYTWGWQRANCTAKVVPMPPCILVGRKEQRASNLKKGILWVPTQHERYQLQFPYLPNYAVDYISLQRRFAQALSKSVMQDIRIRHKPVDYGWALAQRLKENFPELRVDSHETPFAESIKRCRLYVCDHLSTTFIEALYINKPSILFWNPNLNVLREEARPYYESLRRNGILFDTPEEAATAVNEVYHDVETWWNAPARQAAVREFCGHFAMSGPDPVGTWAAEFRRIAG